MYIKCEHINSSFDFFRLVKNLTFGWKALRLLARKSPHFFVQPPSGTGNLYKRVPDYLELIVSKMAKELPVCILYDSDIK